MRVNRTILTKHMVTNKQNPTLITEVFCEINECNEVLKRICNAERKMVVKEALLADDIIMKKKYN